MCTQPTNRTINVRTRIEKDKIVVLFASSVFFYLLFFEFYEKCNQRNVKWSNIYIKMICSIQINVIQLASIKVPIGWVQKVWDNMNARDDEIFKVSYLFTQKEVKRDIYILRIQTWPKITEAATGGVL